MNSGSTQKLKADEASIEIRQSVMEELTKTVDQLDEEHKKNAFKERSSTVFNKQIALKTNKNFMSLRESIGGGGGDGHARES